MRESQSVKHVSKNIQQALRNLKYDYEIEHIRPVHNFVVIKNVDKDHVEYDNCLSRDEFNTAVEELMYIAPAEMPKKYGCFVCTTGGFTRVTITRADGTVVTGKYNFCPKENYNKNLGFVKAVCKVVGKEIKPILNKDLQ